MTLSVSGPNAQAAQAGGAQAPPALDMRGLSKQFLGQSVLVDVDLRVGAGSVHALVGENGSGKSTVVKILSGYYAPDKIDSLAVAETPLAAPLSSRTSHDAGMWFVHQDLGLVEELSVLDNIVIAGHVDQTAIGTIPWRALRRTMRSVLDELGVSINPDSLVRDLGPAQRVMVAVGRAWFHASRNVKLLVLDEVTAALPPDEVEAVFRLIRTVQSSGAGVLYITHRFEEIFRIADWVTVLRDGSVVESRAVAGLDPHELIASVLGAELEEFETDVEPVDSGEQPRIELRNVSGRLVHDLDLSAFPGEIVGITGRTGCGKSEVGRMLFGNQRLARGELHLDGKLLTRLTPRRAAALGVAYVPQDRAREGLLTAASLSENTSISGFRHCWRRGWLSLRRERRAVAALLRRFGVTPAEPDRIANTLSGGNQQKVVFVKWLRSPVRLLILDEPTIGVDVGARADLYRIIADAARDGATVLVLSSNFEEIAQLCSRVLVMRDGKIVSKLRGAEMSTGSLMRASLAETMVQ